MNTIDLQSQRMSKWGNDKLAVLGREFAQKFPNAERGEGLLLMLGCFYTSLAEKIGMEQTDDFLVSLKKHIKHLVPK